MAVNQLQPFANGANANVVSEEEWSGDALKSVVQKGFQGGIAKSEQVNRAIAQGTSAGFAIGQLVADYAGQDAGINAAGLYEGFQVALEIFFKTKMFDTIYPVGSIYIITSATNPSVLFGIGTWERVGAGRGLIDAGAGILAGSTGGNDAHTLTVNEMPAHTHSAQVSEAGGHTHTRGSMTITGFFGAGLYTRYFVNESGAFYATDVGGTKGMDDGGSMKSHYQINFDAARSWSGETSYAGQHSHAVAVGTAGGGQSFSLRNPYLAVYIWKRTA